MSKLSLTLRPLARSDLGWFTSTRNAAAPHLHDPRRFTEEQARDWFAATTIDYRVISAAGTAIGYFRLERDRDEPTALWVGADIAESQRGRGLAFAAYCEFLPVFGREFEVEVFKLRVIPTNVPAISLYRKLGFTTFDVEALVDVEARQVVIRDLLMMMPAGAAIGRGVSAPDFVDHLPGVRRPGSHGQ